MAFAPLEHIAEQLIHFPMVGIIRRGGQPVQHWPDIDEVFALFDNNGQTGNSVFMIVI